MRKLMIAFVTLMVAALLLITLTPLGLPQTVPPRMLYADEDSCWLVENRLLTSYLYRMEQGQVTALRRCPRSWNGQLTTAVAADESEAGLLVVLDDPERNVWQLRAMEASAVVPPALPYQIGDTLLDFDGSSSSITVLTQRGQIEVFSAATEGWTLSLLQEAPLAGRVESAVYRDGTLALLLSGQQAVAVTDTGVQSVDAGQFRKTPSPNADTLPFALQLSCKAVLYGTTLATFAILLLLLFTAKIAFSRAQQLSTRILVAMLTLLLPATCLFSLLLLLLFGRTAIQSNPSLLLWMGLAVLAFVGLSALLLLPLLRRLTQPLHTLREQMELVADGDLTVREIPCRKDELGKLHCSLQELCMSLAIRDYEIESTARSYHRFVPNGLETLLDRASVMEVSLGDSRSILGNVGIFSVCNRQEVRRCAADPAYISFLNTASTLLDTAIRNHAGLLLSTGYEMAEDRVFFPQKNNDGVSAGLDLLGSSAARIEPDTPRFFLLLHRTSFLYGIAGSEENLFPFLSSGELEFLGGYSDRLYSTGARIVLTESFLRQQSGSNYLTRYIGFVASADEQDSFKLYEVLDAYSDLERNLRLRYDPQLQEAISLFYRSDYYLARNLFSSILRICPSDGIARWYLFACEHFFHASDTEEVNYQLFGFSLD